MNVFFIPSWYPSAAHPVYGIFCRDQAEALSNTEVDLAVCLWGQEEYYLNPHFPGQCIERLKSYFLETKATDARTDAGFLEIRTPCLEWTHTLLGGNFGSLLKVCRKNLRRAQEELGPIDLIHAQISYPAGAIAHQLSDESKIPSVITEHMGPFPFQKYLKDGQLYSRMSDALRHASAVLAVSPVLKVTLEAYNANNVSFIPNLVDEKRFIPGPPNNSDFTFFTLCGMCERKGIPDLLHAAGEAVSEDPSIHFRLGGSGEKLDEYRELAKDLGLRNNVSFLGYLEPEEALDEMRGCHAYVMTSHHENFGVVFAEALACGKPIIATRCEGPECIVNDNNGFILDIGDIAGIADAIVRMKRDYSEFDPEWIRDDLMNRFSRKVVVEQILAVYREAGGEE